MEGCVSIAIHRTSQNMHAGAFIRIRIIACQLEDKQIRCALHPVDCGLSIHSKESLHYMYVSGTLAADPRILGLIQSSVC